MTRFLVLPGDVRYNLGDTAILRGTLALLDRVAPGARVSVWGREPLFPGGFENVRFHGRFGPALLADLARADLVVWGGGQLLQSNRSRAKLPYWALRTRLVRLFGRPLVGFAQGVGPLPAPTDRRRAAALVGRTREFSVRDEDSRALLLAGGAPAERVELTADPAILWRRDDEPLSAPDRLPGQAPTIGLALRWTGHHRSDRKIPFQLLPAATRRRAIDTPEFRRFTDIAVALVDRIHAELDADVAVVPMYLAPWETDVLLVEVVRRRAQRPERVRLVRPVRSLDELGEALRGLDAFVGVPMHATILAATRGVPTLAVPYEPKGAAFMERLGMVDRTFPLDRVIAPGGEEELFARVRALWTERSEVRRTIGQNFSRMIEAAERNETVIRRAMDSSSNR